MKLLALALPSPFIRTSACAVVGLLCLFSASQAWSTNCAPPPAGLVAWWPGESTADDIVGTNSGTLVGGVTFTNGEVGQAFSFDGSSGYVKVPNNALGAFGTNSFTVELWASFNTVLAGDIRYPDGGLLIGADEGTGTNPKWWFALGGGVLSFHINNPSVGSYVFLVQAPFTPNLQQWYHLAVVRSGNIFTIFTNGVAIGSATNTIPVPNLNAPLTIGQAEGFYLNGRLDEVSIYGRALLAEEIAAIYNAGSAGKCRSAGCVLPPSGLVSWWPAEGNANDITGTNNGTLLNGATFAVGKVGQAFSFDGTSSYIRIADNPSLHFTNAMTIEAWIYPTSLGAFHNIVSKWDWGAQKAYTTAIQSDGRLVLGVCNDGDCSQGQGGSSGNVWSTTLPPVNEWTHFAVTYDGSALRMYVNGALEGETDYTSGLFPGVGDLIIGAALPGVSPFAGLIDEPAVYNRALSAAEIQAIYNAGSAGKCRSPEPPFVYTQPANQTVTAGDGATFTVGAGGSAPLSLQWSWNGTNIDGATGSVLTLTNVQLFQAGSYRASVSNALGTVVSSNAVLTVNPLVPPVIVTQPASQTVSAGASVGFTVGASGSAPLSYQWRFNGTNVNGATTSKLTLSNVQVASSGNYSALVTNRGGSAISSNGVLAVIPVVSVRLVGTNAPTCSSVTVPVQIVAGGNEYALGFSISFSAASLTYAGVSLGSGASSASLVVNTNLIGSGKVGLELVMPWNTTLAPGTQELARLTFTIPAVTNTTSTTISFGDQPIVRQISDVQANTWPATYSSALVVVAAASALEGDVSPRPSGNRSTALTDWVQLGRYVARLDYPTNASEFQRADCAPRATLGDGRIAVTDWVQTRRYADGLEPLVPAGGPTNEVAGTGPGPSLTRQVRVTDTTMAQGGMGTISVSLAAQGNENALGFGLAFDPALVSFVGAALGNDVAGATLILNTSQVGTGQLGVVLALPTGSTLAAGSREILRVTLQAAPAATGSSTATITDQPVLREISDAVANALPASYFGGTITLHSVLPTLNIAVSGGNVVLSWPAWAAEFNLQTSGDKLLASGNWTNVASVVQTNGGNIFVPLPISDGAGFFRLWHQ